MFEEINKQLTEIKERLRAQKKAQSMLLKAQQTSKDEKIRLKKLSAQLKKENRDVEKLERLSITGLFYQILGNKEEKLDKERQEYIAANLKHDECSHSVKALEREIAIYEKKLKELGDPETEYKNVLEEKEALIMKTGGKQVLRLSENLADVQADIKEINEALDVGNEVLENLRDVISSLKSAKNWGIFDVAGGGIIATAVKHSKIDKANAFIHVVQQNLRRFQRELADVNIGTGTEMSVEISSFSSFADYFFDGLIFDWVVQSKIHKSLDNVTTMTNSIEKIMQQLRQGLERKKNEKTKINMEKKKYIEDA